MIHLLTIRRPFPKKQLCTDHCYYLLPETGVVQEWHTCYTLDSMELLPQLCGKGKESPADSFVINLLEMIEHPCATVKNLDAIRWYANAVQKDEL